MILEELLKIKESKSWIKDVHEKWTPPPGFFTRSSSDIASGLLKASKDQQQAMARLNFYINRAGSNLNAKDKARLEAAKELLMKHK